MVTGQRCKPPNVSVPELEYAGLEAYSVIASASICRPALNSLSCDADSATTAGDCFTADDAEAVISPPPNWTAIQASNMVSHLCIGHKDNKKIRTMKLFFALRFELSHKSPNATQKRRIGSSPHALSACAKPPPPSPACAKPLSSPPACAKQLPDPAFAPRLVETGGTVVLSDLPTEEIRLYRPTAR